MWNNAQYALSHQKICYFMYGPIWATPYLVGLFWYASSCFRMCFYSRAVASLVVGTYRWICWEGDVWLLIISLDLLGRGRLAVFASFLFGRERLATFSSFS